ncbi:hypothetical protein CAter282_3360 [Collimonas arenae]|uniref:Uncharacterized protein n=1 Tax=Collimonas arenae TaxID=279058 RepID=A0A127PTW7_9BURK|nr:hypothetical protein CAter10_3684 [Collimonas arenae]AMP11053.1 hypothetical protein CAter282_3360 [Collimonas arenae]
MLIVQTALSWTRLGLRSGPFILCIEEMWKDLQSTAPRKFPIVHSHITGDNT